MLGDFAGNPSSQLSSITMSRKTHQLKCDETTYPMNCTVRRTSYTMDGFCLLYLLMILLMRSGDVETNPGPNTAESTVSEDEFWTLAQDIAPSYYNAVGISLGFSNAQLQAMLVQNSENYAYAFLEVFMQQLPPHLNKRQLLADKLLKIGLSHRLLIEPNSRDQYDLCVFLADYIRPEDIPTFSCLCKAAYSITRTHSFWKNLYYRYYKRSTALPRYLRPERIPHTGLRTFVIRALYYLYKPYRLALNTTSPVGEGLSSPEAVTDFTCLSLQCHGKYSENFTYFLKLRLESREGFSCYPNIFANDDLGQYILRIRCKHFQKVQLAKIMGLQLVRSSVSVSSNMFNHRVKLEFGRKDLRGLYVKSSIITVILDPVLKVDVLHWWHPLFIETMSVAENAANTK